MQELKIDIEFKQLIPPLTNDEYLQLEQNIVDEGCREPILVWNDIIIDGHNRYEICNKHNLSFEVNKKEFENNTEAKIWIIRNQFGRRNLQTIDRVLLATKMKPLIQEQAKKNKVEMGSISGQLHGQKKVCQNSDKPFDYIPIDTKKELAKIAGISHDTIERVEKISEVKPELIDEIRNGEISINKAYNQIRKDQRIQDIEKQKKDIEEGNVKLPEGVFEVIAVDPPWPYGTEYDPEGRRAANPYPEMSLEEIKSINLPTAENCVLFLWTTHKFMRYSFDILDSWGFRDVAIITWVKDRMGLGTWLRSQSEFCIMAVKGKPQILLTNQTTIIQGAMREHSRKPEEFYKMVDELCIGRKLDYFSRQERIGWETFGNDIEKFKGSQL